MTELRAAPMSESASEPVNELFQELPPLLARGLVYLLITLLAAGVIYATFGRVDDLVTARGKVAPQGLSRQTRALAGGRVRRVAVREGEEVQLNQALVYLDRDMAYAQLARARRERSIRQRQLQDQLSASADPLQVSETRARLAQSEADVIEAQRALENCVVLAPMSGQVTQLTVRGAGEGVQPGQVVAEVAPTGVPFVFDTQVANQDVGRLRVGQQARIKLDAYPHQEYGTLDGTIAFIAPDATSGQDGAAFYRVTLAVEPPRAASPDKQIDLRLGLSGTAEVVTKRRRIIELFFRGLQPD
jgi:hemolysin D